MLRSRRVTDAPRTRASAGHSSHPSFHRLLLLPLVLVLALPAAGVHAAPRLWLPTPPGRPWKVIQGYGCGTHNGWDRYSLDLVAVEGPSLGAPVRAAADGRIWAWTSRSGTLILSHGDGFYTMYTHMNTVVTTERDRFIPRGTVIGSVGDRAANGIAHLHFTAFIGQGLSASPRRSVPLSFAEGYDLPEIGGCSQHRGETLVANGQAAGGAPAVQFSGAVEQGHWYNADARIEFDATNTIGFSQAWDNDPAGDMPMFALADAGYVQLAWAGEGLHTLNVRLWGADGQQKLATYGPFGYDITAPQGPAPIAPVETKAGASVALSWGAASDTGSGVAGYRVYIGGDAAGSSDWFTPTTQIQTPALAAGDYVLRVQALDNAGNAGPWTTIGHIGARARG